MKSSLLTLILFFIFLSFYFLSTMFPQNFQKPNIGYSSDSSKYLCRCDMKYVLLEMDRILRPNGYAIIRESSYFVDAVATIAKGMRWGCRKEETKYGIEKEKILICQKKIWYSSNQNSRWKEGIENNTKHGYRSLEELSIDNSWGRIRESLNSILLTEGVVHSKRSQEQIHQIHRSKELGPNNLIWFISTAVSYINVFFVRHMNWYKSLYPCTPLYSSFSLHLFLSIYFSFYMFIVITNMVYCGPENM